MSDDSFFGSDDAKEAAPSGGDSSSSRHDDEGNESDDAPSGISDIDIFDGDLFAEDRCSESSIDSMEHLPAPPTPIADVEMAGAASSSGAGEAVPDGEVPPPSPAEDPGFGRSRPPAVLFVHGGKLSLYTARAKVFATATCDNPRHGKCVLTKSLEPSATDPAQGRPLGLLLAWLAKGSDQETKEAHWSPEVWPTLPQRRAARTAFAALTCSDAVALRTAERALRPGEDEEPEFFAVPRMRSGA